MGTRSFVLDSAESLSEGELEGAAVDSTGIVVRGVDTTRTALPDASVASCILTDERGISFVGTAKEGKIYRFDGKTASLFAETEALMVTALTRGPGGALLAATLPGGKILRVDAKGKATEFASLEDADYVWALAYDSRKQALYAGTGPNGKIFQIDARGNATEHLDTEAEHIMTLALDERGTLYAGTSNDALLLRVRSRGKSEVVYDFEGNEITSIAIRDGALAVAANLFPKAPSSKKKAKKKTNGKDDQEKSGSNRNNKKTALPTRPKPGKGQLWHIEANGRATRIFDATKGHITAVSWNTDDTIFAATGKDGQVYRVRTDGSHALWIDVDERQVLGLALAGKYPRFVTGDGAAIYQVRAGTGNDGYWISKPLDASFHARWGQLSFRGAGPIRVQTRSGNTEKPDDTWSEWSSPVTKAGPIRSAAARFLQLRAQLGTNARLFAITAHYLPRNQAPIIATLSVAPKRTKKKGKSKAEPSPTTKYTVSWKVANADGDALRYRLAYRPEKATRLRPLLREYEILTKSTFEWDTENVPDGFYVVSLDASDELDNPAGRHETHHRLSEPVLIDNHAPQVRDLRVAGGKLVGRAVDSMGPLRELRYRIDQDHWRPAYPEDDMLDTAVERFSIPLPTLPPGVHVVSVRAVDARHNVGTAELEFTVR